MTIGAGIDDRRRILYKQFRGQGRGAIGRPRCLVRRMLHSLSGRLRRVMAIDAGELLRAIGAALFRRVLQVIERHLAKLGLLRQDDRIRHLGLRAGFVNDQARRKYKQSKKDCKSKDCCWFDFSGFLHRD